MSGNFSMSVHRFLTNLLVFVLVELVLVPSLPSNMVQKYDNPSECASNFPIILQVLKCQVFCTAQPPSCCLTMEKRLPNWGVKFS